MTIKVNAETIALGDADFDSVEELNAWIQPLEIKNCLAESPIP